MNASEFSGKFYRKLPDWLERRARNELGGLSLSGGWEPGRQRTGYEKLNLQNQSPARMVIGKALQELGNPAKFDAWLLRYPVGSEIPPHHDLSREGMCHVRLNALVVAAGGGVLTLAGEQLPLSDGDGYLFRPDLIEHSVDVITQGERLVLSVGANVEFKHAHSLGLA